MNCSPGLTDLKTLVPCACVSILEIKDLITLKLTNNGGNNFSYTVNSSWETTSGATNWNNTSSWAAGTIPVTGQPITIKHSLTLDTDVTVSNITIDTDKNLTIDSSGSLSISSGGTITNNGAVVMNSSSNEYSSLIAVFRVRSQTRLDFL